MSAGGSTPGLEEFQPCSCWDVSQVWRGGSSPGCCVSASCAFSAHGKMGFALGGCRKGIMHSWHVRVFRVDPSDNLWLALCSGACQVFPFPLTLPNTLPRGVPRGGLLHHRLPPFSGMRRIEDLKYLPYGGVWCGKAAEISSGVPTHTAVGGLVV